MDGTFSTEDNEPLSKAFALWLQSVAVVPVASGPMAIHWGSTKQVPSESWTCGYCGERTAMNVGWTGTDEDANGAEVRARPCGGCGRPTFFPPGGFALPRPLPGHSVASLPKDVEGLHNEARRATMAQAYTGAVMCCRKILMNVAVGCGAESPKNFAVCVKFLLDKGHLPATAAGWVDYIRDLGNDANHEIALMNESQAIHVLALTEQLLRNVYELPAMVPKP